MRPPPQCAQSIHSSKHHLEHAHELVPSLCNSHRCFDWHLDAAEASLSALNATVETVQADLATRQGVDQLIAKVGNRPVDALLANAGHGLGKGFLDQEFSEVQHVINTNVTGSIAGFMPGTFQAVYNGTKAFIDSFSYALRNELKDTGVTVTCLMPGATDTEFFVRADLLDTKVGADEHKADPADVAKTGFDAMEKGEPGVVAGASNKLRQALANVMPNVVLAEQHRKMAEPGSARN